MSYSFVWTSWNSEREGSFVDWNSKDMGGGGGLCILEFLKTRGVNKLIY